MYLTPTNCTCKAQKLTGRRTRRTWRTQRHATKGENYRANVVTTSSAKHSWPECCNAIFHKEKISFHEMSGQTMTRRDDHCCNPFLGSDNGAMHGVLRNHLNLLTPLGGWRWRNDWMICDEFEDEWVVLGLNHRFYTNPNNNFKYIFKVRVKINCVIILLCHKDNTPVNISAQKVYWLDFNTDKTCWLLQWKCKYYLWDST